MKRQQGARLRHDTAARISNAVSNVCHYLNGL